MNSLGLPVSAVVLTYNEERNIGPCLTSIRDLVDEIFVVDSGSTDDTLSLVQEFTDKIVYHPFENYSQQRNWAQANLPFANRWVFHLDADERVTAELGRSLTTFFASKQHEHIEGLLVSRRTVFWGRPIWHGGHYPAHHLRIFRRDKGRCEDRLYDQHFIVDGKIQRISGDLVDVITSDLTTWTVRHAQWGRLEALEQLTANSENDGRQVAPNINGNPIERRRWLRSFYGRAPLFLRSFGYFIYRYFIRLGFLDGPEGLVFHFLQGCWFRFYVDAKIFELRQQRVEKFADNISSEESKCTSSALTPTTAARRHA